MDNITGETIPASFVTMASVRKSLVPAEGPRLRAAHHRKFPRIEVHVPVDCTWGEKSVRCHAITLSGGGLFLAEVLQVGPGAEISVRFRPARHLSIMQAKAKVSYSVPGQGTAVQFTEMNPDDRHALLRLIHSRTGDCRLSPRAPLATLVEFQQVRELAFSRDVSLGGMFIESEQPPAVGTQIIVRFNLGYKDRVITTLAYVAYHVKKMGMGVVFTNLSPGDADAISDYVFRTIPSAPSLH